MTFCSHCGAALAAEAKFCSSCGQAVDATISAAADHEALMRAFIGPKNQDYYLAKFRAFEHNGKASASWHWPAFLVTQWWLLYRRMWGWALLYFVFPYILLIGLAIIGAAVGDAGGQNLIGIGYLIWLCGIFVLPGLFADALYYRRYRKTLARAQAQSADRYGQLTYLTLKGGTSNVLLAFIALMGIVAFIGILAAIALPAYQQYTDKAKIFEGYVSGKEAARNVATYYQENGELPGDIADTKFGGTLPPSVKNVIVNPQNGVVVVSMQLGRGNGSLLFVPNQETSGEIRWSCQARDIAPASLPADCR